MENKLLKKTADLFKEYEVWDSYKELERLIPQIEHTWHSAFISELKKINKPKEWTFLPRKNGGVWFLTEEVEGLNSLSIWIENENFSLWANQNKFKTADLKKKISEKEFAPLRDLFPDTEITEDKDPYILKELGNFQYESYNSLSFDQFIWLAGNKPDIILGQLNERLQQFFTPEVTELFKKLNNATRK